MENIENSVKPEDEGIEGEVEKKDDMQLFEQQEGQASDRSDDMVELNDVK